MTSDTPSRIGAYPVERELGRGGMGVVYLARDQRLDRPVAIKVLPEAFATDPERLARFEREARILASLRHPNIAGIHALEEENGRRFLVLEYVEGDTLAEQLARHPLSMEDALEVCRQIAAALEAAHESGVIHRDLKPGNVKRTPAGEVKVLDFGLAKGAVSSQSGSDLSHSPTLAYAGTEVGVILGTASYMSPEQARGKPVDRRTDIWSFGCVLYECLTGRQCFAGETVSDTIAKILEREPDLNALPQATPSRVRDLLGRCLAKDPKQRLRDIGEARILLEEVLAGRTLSGQLIPAAVDPAPRRFGLGWQALAIAMLIGALAGAGLWGLLGSRTPRGTGPLTCVSLPMPPNLTILRAGITLDGRTLCVIGRPKSAQGGAPSPGLLYLRTLDSPVYKPLPGTEGAVDGMPTRDSRSFLFLAPVSAGSPQLRVSRIPLDGSAPATIVADFKDSWRGVARLQNGDLLVMDGTSSWVRVPAGGGAPSAPVKLDAGRPGVSRFELTSQALPGDRGVPINVVSYDARGWHYSVGIADVGSGKVKIVAEDGGNAVYSPTGHLLFTRSDAILAVRFDPSRFETHGAPVAVWSGLFTTFSFQPAGFTLTEDGSICYRPGQASGARLLALLDPQGTLTPWSQDRRVITGQPVISPDGRRFACMIVSPRGLDEIWISDVDHPSLRRLVADPNADCDFPVWSPDGGSITYRRGAQDDRDGIYVQSTAGGEAKRVLRTAPGAAFDIRTTCWLPDGSAILMNRTVAGRSRIELIPVRGAEADSSRLRTVLAGAFSAGAPLISPDGRLLAYQSDESGENELYIASFRSGGVLGDPVQIPSTGAGPTAWSADGKTLYFSDDLRRVMKTSLRAGEPLAASPPVVVADLDRLKVATWSLLKDGRMLVMLRNEDEGEITRFDLVQNWVGALQQKLRSVR